MSRTPFRVKFASLNGPCPRGPGRRKSAQSVPPKFYSSAQRSQLYWQ